MAFVSRSRIPKEDFFHAAPQRVGEQVNINHTNCLAGQDTRQRLYVKRIANGIVAYCHNCGEFGVANNKGWREIKVLQDLMSVNQQQLKEAVAVTVPDDTTYIPTDFPEEALRWLYSSFLDDTQIQKYRIGYSPSWGRTILPVYDDVGNLIFWQGRAHGMLKPKYISVSGAQKPYKVIKSVNPSVFGAILTITEDMLSAIRMAENFEPGIKFDAMPLLGTTISTSDLLNVVVDYQTIMVWLDDDEAGRRKASTLIEQLKLVAGSAVSIYRCDRPQASKFLQVNEGYHHCTKV